MPKQKAYFSLKNFCLCIMMVIITHTNIHGMEGTLPTINKHTHPSVSPENFASIPIFISIYLEGVPIGKEEKSFSAQIKEKYFNHFEKEESLKNLKIENRPHITLFSGRAYPVTCDETKRTCRLEQQGHNIEEDSKLLRTELKEMFRTKASLIGTHLIIHPSLEFWKTEDKETSDMHDFYRSYVVLKLDNEAQTKLSLLHQGFIENLKIKLGIQDIKGGENSGIKYHFYSQSNISNIIKEKIEFEVNKDE